MKIIKQSLLLSLVFLILCGFIYPLFINITANIFFKEKAQGSFVQYNGKDVGSLLIGQEFKNPKFFHGRISSVNYSTGTDKDISAKSGGSNLAPSNPLLEERVSQDIENFMKNNPTVKKEDIPADLMTSSGSGLDPHISVESAIIQADRISKENNLSKDIVLGLIDKTKEKNIVNVLKLNLALLELED